MNCNDLIIVRQSAGGFKCSPITFRLAKKVKVKQFVGIIVNGKKTNIQMTINQGEDTPYFPNNVERFFKKMHCGGKVLKNFTKELIHQMMEESIKVLENKNEENEGEEEIVIFTKEDLIYQSTNIAYYPKYLVTPMGRDLEEIVKHIGENCVETPQVIPFSFVSTVNNKSTEKLDVDLFVYNHNDRLIISDIDGTITKSDVRGVIATVVLKYNNWTHDGICQYYDDLSRKRGYKFVYLTARSVNVSGSTKRYISELEQGKCKLPRGPVHCLTKNKFKAIAIAGFKHNEDIFKIDFMKSVRDLFVNDKNDINPLIAGFGNTPRDLKGYRTVGMEHIFIINKKGVITRCNSVNDEEKLYPKGYLELNYDKNKNVHFPKIK